MRKEMELSKQKNRPFLKWAGGKFGVINAILQVLPPGNTLIEPFVGAGAVFLGRAIGD